LPNKVKDSKRYVPVYLFREKKGGPVSKYGIFTSGKGLWSTLRGFVALDKDFDTITGMTFYEHGETPGLGAECEKRKFQIQFIGKKIRKTEREEPTKPHELAEFLVLKGKVKDKYKANDPRRFHAVDGMSGATITCNGINTFLNLDLLRYDLLYFNEKRALKDD